MTSSMTMCLQGCLDPAVQKFAGIKVVLHEKYSPYSHDWDIAVIELPRPLAYNDFVQPICLPSMPVDVATRCVVTGWGDTKSMQIEFLLFSSDPVLMDRVQRTNRDVVLMNENIALTDLFSC